MTSIELSAAEAAAADTLCGLLSGYPRDAVRQALDGVAFHFKLALKRRRKPRPTLASVAKQASKARIEIARYETKPDGTIVAVVGKGEQQQGNEVDEWIAKHASKTKGH